eukprot:TRINITY_DN64891_c0_g1_i1.p1 TRINITY_DN64891_c0_g1~~TRINITY_DN64891_c0_g1_i1.p1  ORF type:complete len:613 (+),score=62.62 TRINITY_DN64891_c0_g1_i1:170-2008(+)
MAAAAVMNHRKGLEDVGMDIVAMASIGHVKAGDDTETDGDYQSASEGLSEEFTEDSDEEWQEYKYGDSDRPNEYEKQALRKSIWGLYCMYALVGLNYGFFTSFINIPICQYVFGPMGEEGRSSVQQCNVSASIITMPWNFKLFYGFFIDSFPILGSPRKNYIVMGWAISMCLLLYMCFQSEAMVSSGDAGFQHYTILCMVQCVFYMFADVAGDGMTVELTKLEPEEKRGYILTTGQMTRFGSTIFVNVMGLFLMNGPSWLPSSHSEGNATETGTCGHDDPGIVFSFEASFATMHAALFCCQLPFFIGMAYMLRDPPRDRQGPHHRKRDQLRVLWTVSKTKVFLFLVIFSYGSITIGSLMNPASNNIANIAQPSTLQNAVGNIFGSVLFLFGVMTFRKYFMNVNWRITYLWTGILVIGQCGIQLLVVYNAWGIGQDGWFYIFGSNIMSFVSGIAQILSSLATAEIAPPGLEATVYESLASIHNAAITLNANIMNIFIPVFGLNGISSQTYFPCPPDNPNPDQDGMNASMAHATYFTIVVNIVATLFFAVFFPKTKEQTREWREDVWWHKRWVGWVCVLLTGTGFTFSVVVSFLSLFPATNCLQIAGGGGCGEN